MAASKRKASKKKATKRKVAKKKTAKKVAKKKVAKKASKKKTTRRKTAKKKTTKRKIAKKSTVKRMTKKKTAKKKTAKKKVAKRKTTRRKKRKNYASQIKKAIGAGYDSAARRKKRKKKVSSKRKSMTRSVSLSKASPKKRTNRKGRRKEVAKLRKGQAIIQGFTATGGKGRTGKKGARYKKAIITKRTNPMGGTMLNKISKFTKAQLNHDISEIGGLYAGGMLHSVSNDLVTRFVPQNILNMFEGALGPFAGSVAPILVGVLGSKFGGKNDMIQSVSKGLIGAGIVGLGATTYEMVKPAQTMSGYPMMSSEVDSEIGAIETDDFGSMDEDYGAVETDDFGAIETDDFGYMEDYAEDYI